MGEPDRRQNYGAHVLYRLVVAPPCIGHQGKNDYLGGRASARGIQGDYARALCNAFMNKGPCEEPTKALECVAGSTGAAAKDASNHGADATRQRDAGPADPGRCRYGYQGHAVRSIRHERRYPSLLYTSLADVVRRDFGTDHQTSPRL